MTEQEGRDLVAQLAASFPRQSMSPETRIAYADALSQLRSGSAAKDVVDALAFTNDWLPSIAEIVAAYRSYTERTKREMEGAALKAIPETSPPPPAVYELMSKLATKMSMKNGYKPPEQEGLTRETSGRCDECKEDSGRAARFRLGKFVLCRSCADRRLRIRAKVEFP